MDAFDDARHDGSMAVVSEPISDRSGELTGDALVERLRGVHILQSIAESELECLRSARQVHLEPGEFIARQGEMARFFWILLDGELRVSQTQPDGHEQIMSPIPVGTAFGELPLLANVPGSVNIRTATPSLLLQLDEQQFWDLMTSCPGVRKAVLGNMAYRFQKFQSVVVQQEKMAALGTLAAGLMHELNNPGTAAVRAAAQLRDNLLRMHRLTAKFSKQHLNDDQKACMFELQEYALAKGRPLQMNSLEQSDAEETLAGWLEGAAVEDAWKIAPTLVSIGLNSQELECARHEFPGPFFSDALNWLEALVSSMHLVTTIEESIGRISGLVKAVKSYAYEGKGQKQTVDVNDSIHATLVILAHKMREKQITVEKDFGANLPPLVSECSGLNQVWTNLLDNAIDAVGKENGRIRVRTWAEDNPQTSQANSQPDSQPNATPKRILYVAIEDNGAGIPIESQAHVFDPFYTTKPAGVGTGLGLGIVQRIVEQYRGTITFSSEPGRTEFRVRLPIAG